MIDELEQLKKLLWEEWDPIGVNGSGPSDEYDSYALRVYSMLKNGDGKTEIAKYLTWAAIENMGLGGEGYDEAIAGDAQLIASKVVMIGKVK